MKNAILSTICGGFCMFSVSLMIMEIYLMRVGMLSIKLGLMNMAFALPLVVGSYKATIYYEDKANNK